MRFPEFSGEWEKKKLAEASVINPKSENLPTSFVYIDLESVSNGHLSKDVRISKNEAPSRAQRKLQRGDVLFQMVRPYQKNNLYFDKEGEYVASTGYAQIRTTQNAQFIFQYFHNQKFVDRVMERCTGTSYPAISSSDLGSIHIYQPEINEQQKIAQFLELLDSRIQTQNKIIEGLKSSRDTISKLIFSRKVRFKDDSGHAFPEWNVTKLRNISKIYDGTHQTPDYVADGVQFYSVENVTANQFNNTKYIAAEVYDKENKRIKLEKGDILMTRIGSIGVAKYIDWDVKASFYVSLALFKKSLNVNNEFLYHFIKTDFFQTELWKRTIHVAFPKKINLGEIGECLVKIPCSTEQDKIAKMLSTIESKIEFESELLEKMEFQKKYLLANLFI